MQLYVKSTSNCEGLPLQTFEELSPIWSGESLLLPFGDPAEGERQICEVVGWTDLFGGRPCAVHVAKVRWFPQPTQAARKVLSGPPEPIEGWLVWGGNSGVRILDDEVEPIPGLDDHLVARGYGRPIVWVEDADDLPAEVRAVVGR